MNYINKNKLSIFLEKCCIEAEERLRKENGLVRNCYNVGYLDAIEDVILAINSKGGIK